MYIELHRYIQDLQDSHGIHRRPRSKRAIEPLQVTRYRGRWLGFEGNFSIFNVYFTTSPIKNALSFQGALSYCCLTNTQNLEISPPFMRCSVFFEAPDLEEGIIDVDDTQTDTLEVQFLGRYGTGRENPTAKKISPNTSQG